MVCTQNRGVHALSQDTVLISSKTLYLNEPRLLLFNMDHVSVTGNQTNVEEAKLDEKIHFQNVLNAFMCYR